MELFDFVKCVFTDPKKYAEQKSAEKGKHFFLVNRFMAIKYPTTAQQLNRNGINGPAVVDLWQIVASRFQRVPGWIYTKTKKSASTAAKIWKPNPEAAKFWMERHQIGVRELHEAIKYNPEEMKKSFSKLEKQMEMYDR
jgi:hypothetical protein